MSKAIPVSIVRAIIGDIYGRYGLEQSFRSLDPKVQVDIYENWIEIVSKELHKNGLIDQEYERLNVDEMSFVEIVNRTSYYLKNE
jgi:predicted acetyltransferase